MCGIVGILSKSPEPKKEVLSEMIASLRHRGPDFLSQWENTSKTVGLAHARLSILDLTPTGNQPMHSHSGRFTIIYNGEIYNHESIRKAINREISVSWRGTSDTEVILEAFELWGVEPTLTKCVGMFAFALWDEREQTLVLARDRMGEKPLYYGLVNGDFVFGSELRVFNYYQNFQPEIDMASVALFLQFGSVPQPFTIYKNINKLPSATILTYHYPTGNLSIKPYWSFEKVVGISNLKDFTEPQETIQHFENLLSEAIKLQMQADVKVGAFLSGGVDSSAVAAVMQANSSGPINTYTIGFEEKAYNEAEFAKAVARHIGSNHHEAYVTGKDALEIVPKLGKIYDEPYSESSQIPTVLLTQMASKHVKVCLSGDGGDELFGGYERYHWAFQSWKKISVFPPKLRRVIACLLKEVPYGCWNFLIKPIGGASKDKLGIPINKTDRWLKFLDVMHYHPRENFYFNGFIIHNRNPYEWLIDSELEVPNVFSQLIIPEKKSFFEEMMAIDQQSYLINNGLYKSDRTAMAVSLETRTPLLDHRIVEFSHQLPLKYKIHPEGRKWILRQVLYKHVPKELIERPKMGFSVPIREWLLTDLKPLFLELVNEKSIKEQGIFDYSTIQQKWVEFESGKRNWQYHLWDVLIFQLWYNEQMSKR